MGCFKHRESVSFTEDILSESRVAWISDQPCPRLCPSPLASLLTCPAGGPEVSVEARRMAQDQGPRGTPSTPRPSRPPVIPGL